MKKKIKNALNQNVNKLEGTIVKSIAGFYYVLRLDEANASKTLYECRARGKFRLQDKKPLVGDYVMFEIPFGRDKGGYVTEIFARKNKLLRPPAANIDQFVLLLSASRPYPDFLLADKLLLQAQRQGIEALIVFNKWDVAEKKVINILESDYSMLPINICKVSAFNGFGIDELQKHLYAKLSCFAGQSAVGKSSLINKLTNSSHLETGDLSNKTGRGRHTTRAVELRLLDNTGYSFVMDTPGFSIIDIDDMQPNQLSDYYPEMKEYKNRCRFDDCLHKDEPHCAVKQAVEEGAISKGRYMRYQIILAELEKKKNMRYR